MRYKYTPHPYLDAFGLNVGETKAPYLQHKIPFIRKMITGPRWNGFTDFDIFRKVFEPIIKSVKQDQLISFEKAFRVHPCQTIQWQQEGHISQDIFGEIVKETTAKYHKKHQLGVRDSQNGKYTIAMHISRGTDFDRNRFPIHFEKSYNARFMFSMGYFLNIYQQITDALGQGRTHFDVFTEEKNSEDIIAAFGSLPNASLHIGCNRHTPDELAIHKIFQQFVSADLLVSCNSSFSTEALYFRGDKPSIYHPHIHMHSLPVWPYLATDFFGNFDVEQLATLA